MKALSLAQREMLRSLAQNERCDRWGWGASSTNPTGCALKRLGLARYEYDRSKQYTWGRWVITDAGRAAL